MRWVLEFHNKDSRVFYYVSSYIKELLLMKNSSEQESWNDALFKNMSSFIFMVAVVKSRSGNRMEVGWEAQKWKRRMARHQKYHLIKRNKILSISTKNWEKKKIMRICDGKNCNTLLFLCPAVTEKYLLTPVQNRKPSSFLYFKDKVRF